MELLAFLDLSLAELLASCLDFRKSHAGSLKKSFQKEMCTCLYLFIDVHGNPLVMLSSSCSIVVCGISVV